MQWNHDNKKFAISVKIVVYMNDNYSDTLWSAKSFAKFWTWSYFDKASMDVKTSIVH